MRRGIILFITEDGTQIGIEKVGDGLSYIELLGLLEHYRNNFQSRYERFLNEDTDK